MSPLSIALEAGFGEGSHRSTHALSEHVAADAADEDAMPV